MTTEIPKSKYIVVPRSMLARLAAIEDGSLPGWTTPTEAKVCELVYALRDQARAIQGADQ